MNFVLSESELYLKVVPMDWIIFFVILGHLKMFDIRHALYLIRSIAERCCRDCNIYVLLNIVHFSSEKLYPTSVAFWKT